MIDGTDGAYMYKQVPFTVLSKSGTGLIVCMPIDEINFDLLETGKAKLRDITLRKHQIIAAGDTKDIDLALIKKLVVDGNTRMPANFDCETRSAPLYKTSIGRIVKQVDGTAEKYFKYHISLIGNPELAVVFNIDGDTFKQTEVYQEFINQFQTTND